MATFVLVSGAWHAGWCWERVVPLLEAAGHRVLAPDLLGMGPEPTPIADVTLAGWADQIANLVRAQHEPVVLVGHSRGGIVISEAAERVPERIARLVYLSAFLLPSGMTLFEGVKRGPRTGLPEMLDRQGEVSSTVKPGFVAGHFYNTTEGEWIARARARLTPEPTASFVTPLALTEARFGRVPRAYVECTEDRAVPLELQRLMQAELPCDRVATLATDHSPFLSAPEDLAAALACVSA